MFGNRKKNRDGEILDTNARKRERARGRWRLTASALLALALVGGVGYGAWMGWRWSVRKLFTENPRYAIAQIVVENNSGLLSSVQIIKASGAQAGQNLFALDLTQMRRDIELLPIVERAEVRRELPDRLTLRVFERAPVLRFAVYFPTERGGPRQVTLYLDKTGHVMDLPSPLPGHAAHYAKLPWLTGLRATEVRVGKAISAPAVADALKLLNEWETSAASSAFPLTQIDVSRPEQLALVNTQGSVAVVSPPDFKAQLARLAAIVADANAKRKVVRLADLSVRQNVPVTFRN